MKGKIQVYYMFGTCLLSKLSIPRLHDEAVSTIATHRPTKTVLQKEPYLQNKKPHHHRRPTQPNPHHTTTTQHHPTYKTNRPTKKSLRKLVKSNRIKNKETK